MTSTDAWRRLADAVIARRAQRGWNQIDIANRGPMSLDRVQKIEGAKLTRYRPATIAALERALDWEYGSVDAILAGGNPTPMPSAESARQKNDLSGLTVSELTERVEQLLEKKAERRREDELLDQEVARVLEQLRDRNRDNGQRAG